MSRTYKDSRAKYGDKRAGSGRPDRLVVRGIRRHPVDAEKFGRALLDLAMAQEEADAAKDAAAASEREHPDGTDHTRTQESVNDRGDRS